MSNTGNILTAETSIHTTEGVSSFVTHYFLATVSANGHTDGVVSVPVTDMTESTFNLTVQQACADRANLESGDVEGFTASDVFGGRI